MRNNIKSCKGMSNVVAVLLIVIILILVVGIAYLLKNQKTEYVIQDRLVSEQTEKNLADQVKGEEKQEVKEMTSDEKYKIFAENLKKEVSEYGVIANKKWSYVEKNYAQPNNSNKVGYEIELGKNGNLKLKILSDEDKYKNLQTDKLATNVLSFSIVNVGQVGENIVYFIKEDGTVGFADVYSAIFEDTKKIKIENNISGLKNIVAIIDGAVGLNESGGYNPLFIDIDGMVHSLQS